MKVERKILKSISEFSVFKYVLVAYLIFFILFVIVFAIISLIGWAVLATSGVTLTEVLNSLIPGLNFEQILAGMGIGIGGGVIGLVIFIIIGIVASVFAAGIATLMAWIYNVVLKITGGIEMRFAPEKSPAEQNMHPSGKFGEKIQEYNINNQ